MPMDSWFNHYSKHLGWEKKFCFLPKRSAESGKLLWLTFAMRGVKLITGPGEPVMITYWQGQEEHLMWKLKR